MEIDYAAVTTRLARKAGRKLHRQVQGVPLFSVSDMTDVAMFKPPFPISGCLCVQDSPENPCPCTDIVFWPLDPPLAVAKTDRKNDEGKDVLLFTFPRNVRVQVQVMVPIELNDLEQLARVSPRVRQIRRDQTLASAKKDGMSFPDLGWIKLAAGAGYAVGQVLDDLAGSNEGDNDNLSDDLSDWAADNFPAPGWLKDIF